MDAVQSSYITCILTLFLCWAAQEVMERQFGMSPAIRRTNSLADIATKSTNPLKTNATVRRLTKQLDEKGRFRIQTRGTIYYIKGMWNIAMWIATIYGVTHDTSWFPDHFFNLEASSTRYGPYVHLTASILAFYAWEMNANRYAKLNYSIIVHHWLTSFAALFILLGNYNPFATWYGFTAVQSVFPIWFILGLRATFSHEYPELTRKGFIFAFYWYLFVICCNMAGQVFLIVNALTTGKIPIYSVVLIIIAICGWMYDDISLLRSLYDFSTHNYEDAELFSRKRTARELGGRALFARSIIMDLGEFEKSQSNSGQHKPYKSPSGHHLSPAHSASMEEKVNNESGNSSDVEMHQTEKIKMKEKQQNHLENRYNVESKIVNEMQIRLNPKISSKSVIDGKDSSEYGSSELVKQRDSIDPKEFRSLADKFYEKGTFHSTTDKGNMSDVADTIAPTETDRDLDNYRPSGVAGSMIVGGGGGGTGTGTATATPTGAAAGAAGAGANSTSSPKSLNISGNTDGAMGLETVGSNNSPNLTTIKSQSPESSIDSNGSPKKGFNKPSYRL